MIAMHLSLACRNQTTIENNYQNMPNPFDQGDATANLAQVFGVYSVEWFFPITPSRPLADGASFPRYYERDIKYDLGKLVGEDELDVERLWRVRYQVLPPPKRNMVNVE